MKISFRPHHFMCTLGFQGMGYTKVFTENYTSIVKELQENEDTLIEVVKGSDSICSPCPHRRAAVCEAEEKIQGLDTRHSQVLNIHPGDTLTWGEAKKKIKENMSLEAFHTSCEGCEWKNLGVCEQALIRLRDEGGNICGGR